MKSFKELLNKHSDETTESVNDSALSKSIQASLIGIFICIVCLAGLTWAWFTTSVSSSSNKIVAASYDAVITVTEDGTSNDISPTDAKLYSLDPAKTYHISITKSGTAKKGFCHLSIATEANGSRTIYFTSELPESDAYILTVSGITEIKITPMWGAVPSSNVISSGGELNID